MANPIRLRRAGAAALLCVAALTDPARAQGAPVSPQCSGRILVEDACQVAVDLFTVLAPQLTGALGGGELPMGGMVRGDRVASVALSVRVTAVRGFLPDFDSRDIGVGPAVRRPIASAEQVVPAPVLDVGVGVWRGFGVPLGTLGTARVASLALLGDVSFLPTVREDEVRIATPGGSLRVGGGARVGLLEGVRVLPDLSLAVIDRGLPTVDVHAATRDGDSLRVDGLRVRVTSWRLGASKQLGPLGVSAGVGRDRARAEADVTALVRQAGVPLPGVGVALSRSTTRTILHAGLSVGVGPVALAGEIGRLGAVDAEPFNPFPDDEPGAARVFGSLGVRLAF